MNKFIYTLALFVAFCFSTEVFAHGERCIDSHDVMIGNNGIFVKIDGSVFQVQSIFYDGCKIYIPSINMKKCDDCGRDYPGYERECPYSEMHDDNNNKNDY